MEHQIRLSFVGHDIAVSCTCQAEPPEPGRHRHSYRAFEIRPKWTTPEIMKVFREARHSGPGPIQQA